MFSVVAVTRARAAALLAAACALVLAGCVATPAEPAEDPVRIVVGTTDPVTSLDPAAAYDSGSFAVMSQVHRALLICRPGMPEAVQPDLAETAAFDDNGDYVVTLRKGLHFANGNKLTSADVKFSFDRILAINADTGPWALLGNLDAIETPDATTVIFRLKKGNDQTFPQVLSSPAAFIVDEETFSADAVTSDEDVVKGGGFAGQYTISDYRPDERAVLTPNPLYSGPLGSARNDEVELRFYGASGDLARDVREQSVDIAAGSLAAGDLAELRGEKTVRVVDGPAGEIRYLVFDFAAMPYGAKQADADPVKSLAVRQAIADVIDREAISNDVYGGGYAPLYAHVPDGLEGANPALLEMYGDGTGGPDAKRAAERLAAAGVETPVRFTLHHTSDHYGESSAEEYETIAKQLNDSKLFRVDVSSEKWESFAKTRTTGAYAVYQLGTFPDFDDADTYLSPYFSTGNVLKNGYSDAEVDTRLAAQRSEADLAARTQLVEDIQQRLAAQLPTLPLLQGTRHLVVVTGVSGAALEGTFAVRFGNLTR